MQIHRNRWSCGLVFAKTFAMKSMQGVFCDCRPPKKFKYGKPRLGEPTLT